MSDEQTRTHNPDQDPPKPGTFPPEVASLLKRLDLPGGEATVDAGGVPNTVTGLQETSGPSVTTSGLSVPGYEILGELGRGGMGVVFKAKQHGLNRLVALKMVLGGPYADPAARARFLVEAESVAALEHPHVVRVFAFGEHAGHPFLAMEFLPAGTLADRVKADGPLPAREAAELVAQLAEAVAHAHARGVIHRDIKPSNVLLTDDGEPRLTDFGLAKVGRSDMTATGAVIGTPAYMSPEQAAGKTKEIGTGSDIYSLGAVLYDLLTGRPPFHGDSVAVTLQKVIAEEPTAPRKLLSTVPPELETICVTCLQKEAAARYPTAQALVDDLRRHLRGEPISVVPAGVVRRAVKWVKRNRGLTLAATAVSAALLVGSGVAIGFGVKAANEAKRATAEARRADREAEEAKRLETEVRLALGKSRDLSTKLKAALDESRQRAALNYLAYGQLSASASKLANAPDHGSSAVLQREFQRTVEWIDDAADPVIREAVIGFTDALAEWDSGAPPAILRQHALRIARACRDSWLNNIASEYPDLARQIQERLYDRVCSAAKSLRADSDPGHVRRCREEIMELYWGELAIVETKEVELAMVGLGKVLDRWPVGDRRPADLDKAVEGLFTACGRKRPSVR